MIKIATELSTSNKENGILGGKDTVQYSWSYDSKNWPSHLGTFGVKIFTCTDTLVEQFCTCYHVKWNFLEFITRKKGFGDRWRKWIIECVSSTTFCKLSMGGLGNVSIFKRDLLRQENLLSPLLFVLVVDAWSFLVEKEISCFRVRRNVEEMSHLQFVKDTICFTTKDNQVWEFGRDNNFFSLVSGWNP